MSEGDATGLDTGFRAGMRIPSSDSHQLRSLVTLNVGGAERDRAMT